jgi:hypothetical protein
MTKCQRSKISRQIQKEAEYSGFNKLFSHPSHKANGRAKRKYRR